MRPPKGGRCGIVRIGVSYQRAGGHGEAGAGAGEGAGSGAMAVGAVRGAGLGFFLTGAGFLAPGGGAAGCNSTKTGFGTNRGVSGSAPGSPAATTFTGTVCG